uniref:Metaxin-1-like n=1 Tax=Phallusia mammillata TaxID=59560 RepID=A0A6F9DM79_9ASCI|nr:metaxin-1-like [Phallusia mammillata]
MEERENLNIKLKCWGGDWDLPTIDIDSLSVICYAKIRNVPVKIEKTLPKNTITGTLPELEVKEIVYSNPLRIIGKLRKEGYNADFHLTEDENADTLAFLAYIKQKLKPAILYTLWLDAGNYTKVIRPAYATVCGFPWSLWYPSKIRKAVEQSIYQAKGGTDYEELHDIEKRLYRDAHECLNVLEKKLGNNEYFFGKSPSTFDAVLYGHLSILLKAPLVSTEIKNHLNACKNLTGLCFRLDQMYFPKVLTSSSPSKSVENSPEKLLKRDQIITIAAALGAMIVYALTSGVLTHKSSKLAERIQNHGSAIEEFDTID